ncbi:CGP-CTERM sorting domain-containing protein [Thermococcus sp. M36]|nr:CGP-CTERM sorting domain-containing protein [Thermococcus sp. M36]
MPPTTTTKQEDEKTCGPGVLIGLALIPALALHKNNTGVRSSDEK